MCQAQDDFPGAGALAASVVRFEPRRVAIGQLNVAIERPADYTDRQYSVYGEGYL